VVAAATIFAAPELRDLKKEATTFVPTAVKRRKVAPSNGPSSSSSSSRVNAAPSFETADVDTASDPVHVRPNLVDVLKGQFGPVPALSTPPAVQKPTAAKKKDEFHAFVEGISDLL
jgi:hypothetical protein